MSSKTLDAARSAIATRISFETALTKFDARSRRGVEQYAASAGEPGHLRKWERLVTLLVTLAPHAAVMSGGRLRFYAADGKYRRQLFAMHDEPAAGAFHIYCENTLPDPLLADAVGKLKTDATAALQVERIDSTTGRLDPHIADMVGWNRRALHLRLAGEAGDPEMSVVELLCALSVRPR